MVALVNDRRLQRGLPPLGFLNPALYQLQEQGHGAALYDVSGAGTGTGVLGAPEWVGAGAGWVSWGRGDAAVPREVCPGVPAAAPQAA